MPEQAIYSGKRATDRTRMQIRIRGAVQGVGFRPFVYRLARELGLSGFVRNTLHGLSIEVEGEEKSVRDFVTQLQRQPPPHAVLHSVQTSEIPANGAEPFSIETSQHDGKLSANVLPDLAVCDECLAEMQNPQDRRTGYPFINCTHCGPRFTIIEAMPYDRPNTSMKQFAMCPQCQAEYADPMHRRFHAQPTACAQCGPNVELWDATGRPLSEKQAAITEATRMLADGQIVAVKGLGGFHLLVDARNDAAVQTLRRRKHREEKPLALMFPNLNSVRTVCELSELEERLLTQAASPIVLLKKKEAGQIAGSVAPGNPNLGAMLPYTPLHHLLLSQLRFPVVATSGNCSDEPIVTDETEALSRLRNIADAFLVHDRPIVRHADDSIMRVVNGAPQILRRARGMAPLPISVQQDLPEIIAVGGHLKNSVAFARGHQVFMSQHIGDLDTPEAVAAFEQVINDLQRLLNFEPVAVACDQHPDYVSTRFARTLGVPVLPIQHHHAHIVSCMAENQITAPVLGIAWDGTGYGSDGTIWGGEFLLSTADKFQRVAHLRTFPLPGGDQAAHEGWRTACGMLHDLFGDKLWDLDLPPVNAASPKADVFEQMLARQVNSPRSSAVGRLFDAVAALIGLKQNSSFEGQAAMLLEFAADGNRREFYPFEMSSTKPIVLDWRPMVEAIVCDVQAKTAVSDIAVKFHNTLVEMMAKVARSIDTTHKIVMTGGCFQNKRLTEHAYHRLTSEGFEVYQHRQVPPGDGGLALGQAMAAAAMLQKQEMTNSVNGRTYHVSGHSGTGQRVV